MQPGYSFPRPPQFPPQHGSQFPPGVGFPMPGMPAPPPPVYPGGMSVPMNAPVPMPLHPHLSVPPGVPPPRPPAGIIICTYYLKFSHKSAKCFHFES